MKRIPEFYDIAVPSLATSEIILQWAIICLALILLLVLIMIWKRYRQQEHDALSSGENQCSDQEYRIEEIEALWKGGDWGDRQTAYFLARTIRYAFDIGILDPACPPSLRASSQQWSELIQILDALRYQKETHVGLQPKHFEYLKSWLA
ncbi:MAG: hypothetical protein D6698_06680 [Gammaproteobacteria bacterium]|nr:MAG: hypothetical protein D6698_06680 [Gammaproteobacteria bacterium]